VAVVDKNMEHALFSKDEYFFVFGSQLESPYMGHWSQTSLGWAQ
jgi:hypothetical protein